MAILPCPLHVLTMRHEDLAGEQSREAEAAKAEARRIAVVALAKEQFECEGDLEIDDDARLSESEDNGVYVAAWIWLPFDGTAFDKEPAQAG